ncbi:hypothetical protein [Brevibacillus parabrevis]|uniref:hypothetical protein n=1 Tax=Brevibacillus parabrevis TaxID=54914 RepID=UPI0028533789|nr:hypothetical protein [Brevibacillus parabrevis]MDR5001304.1 hypothetical protein [Brevibacillus parabrevis]
MDNYRISSLTETTRLPYEIASLTGTTRLPYQIASLTGTTRLPYRIASLVGTTRLRFQIASLTGTKKRQDSIPRRFFSPLIRCSGKLVPGRIGKIKRCQRLFTQLELLNFA